MGGWFPTPAWTQEMPVKSYLDKDATDPPGAPCPSLGHPALLHHPFQCTPLLLGPEGTAASGRISQGFCATAGGRKEQRTKASVCSSPPASQEPLLGKLWAAFPGGKGWGPMRRVKVEQKPGVSLSPLQCPRTAAPGPEEGGLPGKSHLPLSTVSPCLPLPTRL